MLKSHFEPRKWRYWFMRIENYHFETIGSTNSWAKENAHLFEHLMFGGSINIKDYDEPLQRAGGENNAYTTNDFTNYYCQLPTNS